MQVTLDGELVAEADADDVVLVEGNSYVPKSALADGARLEPSATPYTCPWKGAASYWNVVVGDTVVADGAWSYEQLRDGAIDRVGADFAGHVAFDRRKLDVS